MSRTLDRRFKKLIGLDWRFKKLNQVMIVNTYFPMNQREGVIGNS
jgi:hypothetical protein